jgi:hypothetical protein
MIRPKWQRLILAATSGVIIISVVRCSEPPSSTDVKLRGAVVNPTFQKDVPARAALARERTAWMGDVHSAFVQDLTKNRAAWLGRGKKTRAEKCKALWAVLRKYMPRVVEHGQLTAGAVEAVESYARKNDCHEPSGLMAFASSPQNSARAFSMFGSVGQGHPTGAYYPYYGQLEAVFGWAEHPDQVAAASWAIVNQASADGIPQIDLEVLSGLASIGVSSAYDWHAYEQNGGFNPPPSEQWSLFQGMRYWRRIGLCDLFGAFLGGWSGGFPGAVVMGATASGICILSLW